MDEGTLTLKGAQRVDPQRLRTSRAAGTRWSMATEGQHGISIIGGADITLNRPKTRSVKGDGIYVGYGWGQSPRVRIVVNTPDIERSARNGIAVVAGEATITGGRIVTLRACTALDLEPNTQVWRRRPRGSSSAGPTSGSSTTSTRFPGSGTRSAAAGATRSVRKPLLRVENLTGDRLEIVVGHLSSLVVTGCVFRRRGDVRDLGHRLLLGIGQREHPRGPVVTLTGSAVTTRPVGTRSLTHRRRDSLSVR